VLLGTLELALLKTCRGVTVIRKDPDPSHNLNLIYKEMARTKQTARRAKVAVVPMVPTSSLGPAGTKSEWKRIDEVYDAETGRWVFRDSAPFSSTEVSPVRTSSLQ
jgi:hypothetical protein